MSDDLKSNEMPVSYQRTLENEFHSNLIVHAHMTHTSETDWQLSGVQQCVAISRQHFCGYRF